MYNKFIIKSLKETENSYIISGGQKSYEVFKIDLNGITLAQGDPVAVIEHPNFFGQVAGLDLNGHRVFHKSREEVIDEYFSRKRRLLYNRLPALAKHRIHMLAMFRENFFNDDFLKEVIALNLGYRLYSDYEKEDEIETFGNLSFDDQAMVLPGFSHPLLPQIPAEKVVNIAKAFLHDEQTKVSAEKLETLADSEIMKLPNVTSTNHGYFYEPRPKFIKKYVAAVSL